jgi:hypothetical protein
VSRIHKILRGDGAARYLPFALSRLWMLRQIHGDAGFFSQTFIVDEANIKVRKVGEDEYIDIDIQGGFYFEFITSANPPKLTTFDIPLQGEFLTYDVVTVASEVVAKEGAITLKPFVRLNGRNPAGNSINQRTVQVQLIDETVYNPTQSESLRTKQLHQKSLYESYACKNSHVNSGARNTQMHYAPFQWVPRTGNVLTHSERDYGYDEQWAFGEGLDIAKNSTFFTKSYADWPRHAGYQTVESEEWGTRTFGIMVDYSNRFFVFPVGAVRTMTAETIGQTVEDKYMRDAYPAFPSWVYTNSEMAKDFLQTHTFDEWNVDLPEYAWNFNLSGTKAVCVPSARSAYNNDSAYYAADPDPDTPWSDTKFGLMRDELLSFAANFRSYPPIPTYNPQRYFYAPGLVECTLNFTLTGPNLEDYEFSLSTAEIRNPNDNLYFTGYAGYSWIDSSVTGTEVDDLIVVDFEMFGRTIRAPSGYIDSTKAIYTSWKNLTKGTELWCTKGYQVYGINIAYLTMAVKLVYEQWAIPTTWANATGSGTISGYKAINHHGVWVIRSGETKEILYPDSMEQATRDTLAGLAVFGQRQTITDMLLTGEWAYVPLKGLDKDGWSDTTYNDYRRYWAGKKHYYYVDPWVFSDPDWDFHGTDPFADEGWVRYRTSVGAPANYQNTEQEIMGYMAPDGTRTATWRRLSAVTTPRSRSGRTRTARGPSGPRRLSMTGTDVRNLRLRLLSGPIKRTRMLHTIRA